MLVLGDSLSAAYGIDPSEGWVALLEQRLGSQASDWRVVNASISGDTTRGGAARIARALTDHQPQILILELGGNDGLRGLAPTATERNLAQIIDASVAAEAKVLLLGMQMPPNYGPVFTKQFAEVYKRLGERPEVSLVPFFLEGVGDQPDLIQADGIHPTAEAQPRLLDNVWPYLEPLLD